jgi:hypothetical protein
MDRTVRKSESLSISWLNARYSTLITHAMIYCMHKPNYTDPI